MRTTLSILSVLSCLVLGLSAAPAHAQYADPAYEDPDSELMPYGYRDHTGFFSHIDIGLGWTMAKAQYSSIDIENRGLGSAWHLGIGGSVMPRLAVHFSAFGFDTFGGDLLIDGEKAKNVDGGVTSSALGAGVTYYLPMNLYFSGSVGVAFAAIINSSGNGKTLKPGLAARAALGYEWWIGAYWGLGIAGQLQFLRATDDDYDGEPVWNSLVFGPAFTATSN